ncbi:rod-binding protein [bacterium]|nr:rod-binding protein [bacterium]
MVGIDSLNPGGVGQAFLPGVTGLDTCTIRASSESPKAREARFWKVAQSFQAIFIRQLLSSMRQGELGQDLLGASHGSKMVREMHDDLVAEKVAEGDRGGLARIIYDDLVRLEVNDTDKARARLEQKENAPRDVMPLSE